MRLRYGLIADYANVTQDGKLNILGVTDRIFANTFPAMHRDLFLIVCIETEAEDDGATREIHVQMINADGQTITELKGQLNIQGPKQVLNQIHLFRDVWFTAAGSYQFNVFFDGKMVHTIDLELLVLPPQSA